MAFKQFLGELRGKRDFWSFTNQWQAHKNVETFLWQLKGCQDLCSYLHGQQQQPQQQQELELEQVEQPIQTAATPAEDVTTIQKHADQHMPRSKGLVATMCKQLEDKLQATRPAGYWLARQLDNSSKPVMKPARH